MHLDTYDFKARLRPALIVLLPAALIAGLWVTPDKWPWTVIGIVAGWLGLGYLVAQVARDLGRAAEPRLFELWGGKPTTVALRHAGPTAKPALVQYHARLARFTAGGRFPTPEEELANPSGSDEAYSVAIDGLRAAARGVTLVGTEAINYAYRRNLWSMKALGLVLSGAAAVCSFLAGFPDRGAGFVPPWAVLVAAMLLLAFWIGLVQAKWVHRAALRYRDALLNAVFGLGEKPERTS